MKLISITKYNIQLKDWDINHIKTVKNTYGKVSKDIHLQIQILLSNILDIRFQISLQ